LLVMEWVSDGLSEWWTEWVSEWWTEWVSEWVMVQWIACDGVSEWWSEWVMDWVSDGLSEWWTEWVSEWVSDGAVHFIACDSERVREWWSVGMIVDGVRGAYCEGIVYYVRVCVSEWGSVSEGVREGLYS
jgi:hypothetical protein